jgi:glutaminyl-tRNA synthetase
MVGRSPPLSGDRAVNTPPRPDRRAPGKDFIRAIVEEDLRTGRYGGRVVTRFPPEPNGFLHIGHPKSLLLNFGIAREYGGRCHLRFDDTNPEVEEERYVEAIKRDVKWLGFDWGEHLYFASDYFERMYECAEILVKKGKAYVDSQTEEEIREGRGSLTEPGRAGPYRDRTVDENLDLFRRMRAGEFPNGAHVLRAKIDLAHPNMIMRDPVLYRIRHATHYRTGDAWCIYPLYDFAHCLEDAFEDITHSICTLEFEINRELYDWVLDEVGYEEPRTHQYEFARGVIDYTIVAKRKLRPLVEAGLVSGWDDPRMPTVAAFRRRGVPAEAILAFWRMIGVSKADARIDLEKLEFSIRDHLNLVSPRVMCVLRPLKVVITNYPEGKEELLEAPYFPRDVGREGSRSVPFSRELWIERDDFEMEPPEDFYRMSPGVEVRLRYGYVVRCTDAVVDPKSGEVVEVRCTYDPATRGGSTPDKRRIDGTIHWVSAAHALTAEVRVYDRLFRVPDPEDVPEGGDFMDHLNPESLVTLTEARIEPSVAKDAPDTRYQFERNGYFWRDPEDSKPNELVFNRIVTLRDTWAKQSEAGRASEVAHGRSTFTEGARGRPAGARKETRDEAPRPSEAREEARRSDPELGARMTRYQTMGLSREEADILTGSRTLSDFFEAAVLAHPDAGAVAGWVVNELPRAAGETPFDELKLSGTELGRLVALVSAGRIARLAAKDVLNEMVATGADPEELVRARGLERVETDDALLPLVDSVLAEWSGKVDEYRAGKTGLLGFFVGQVVRRTEGRGDPVRVKALLLERLGSSGGGASP